MRVRVLTCCTRTLDTDFVAEMVISSAEADYCQLPPVKILDLNYTHAETADT